MESIFLLCAIVGGTVMLLQFAMTLMGLGDDGADVGGDADFDTEFGGDVSGADVGDVDVGDVGDVDVVDADGVRFGEAADADVAPHTSTSWIFGVISFRTVVAAIAFFGMAGKAARASGFDMMPALIIAVGAGLAAMYAVYMMMQTLYKLRSDGTVRIERSIGLPAQVYLPIPPRKSGAGKVHLSLQGRTVEYAAMTGGEEPIRSGTNVEVVRVLGPQTVEVDLLPEEAPVHEVA